MPRGGEQLGPSMALLEPIAEPELPQLRLQTAPGDVSDAEQRELSLELALRHARARRWAAASDCFEKHLTVAGNALRSRNVTATNPEAGQDHCTRESKKREAISGRKFIDVRLPVDLMPGDRCFVHSRSGQLHQCNDFTLQSDGSKTASVEVSAIGSNLHAPQTTANSWVSGRSAGHETVVTKLHRVVVPADAVAGTLILVRPKDPARHPRRHVLVPVPAGCSPGQLIFVHVADSAWVEDSTPGEVVAGTEAVLETQAQPAAMSGAWTEAAGVEAKAELDAQQQTEMHINTRATDCVESAAQFQHAAKDIGSGMSADPGWRPEDNSKRFSIYRNLGAVFHNCASADASGRRYVTALAAALAHVRVSPPPPLLPLAGLAALRAVAAKLDLLATNNVTVEQAPAVLCNRTSVQKTSLSLTDLLSLADVAIAEADLAKLSMCPSHPLERAWLSSQQRRLLLEPSASTLAEQVRAACRIQGGERGRRGRMAAGAKRKEVAATRIQARIRGGHTRSQIASTNAAEVETARHEAATRIQSIHRGNQGRTVAQRKFSRRRLWATVDEPVVPGTVGSKAKHLPTKSATEERIQLPELKPGETANTHRLLAILFEHAQRIHPVSFSTGRAMATTVQAVLRAWLLAPDSGLAQQDALDDGMDKSESTAADRQALLRALQDEHLDQHFDALVSIGVGRVSDLVRLSRGRLAACKRSGMNSSDRYRLVAAFQPSHSVRLSLTATIERVHERLQTLPPDETIDLTQLFALVLPAMEVTPPRPPGRGGPGPWGAGSQRGGGTFLPCHPYAGRAAPTLIRPYRKKDLQIANVSGDDSNWGTELRPFHNSNDPAPQRTQVYTVLKTAPSKPSIDWRRSVAREAERDTIEREKIARHLDSHRRDLQEYFHPAAEDFAQLPQYRHWRGSPATAVVGESS